MGVDPAFAETCCGGENISLLDGEKPAMRYSAVYRVACLELAWWKCGIDCESFAAYERREHDRKKPCWQKRLGIGFVLLRKAPRLYSGNKGIIVWFEQAIRSCER